MRRSGDKPGPQRGDRARAMNHAVYISKDKRIDYITVDIPADAFEDDEEREDAAISAAREELTTYAIPAAWRVVWKDGDLIRVARESHPFRARPHRPRRKPDMVLVKMVYGHALLKHLPTGTEYLVQTDYDHPGVAGNFGWTPRKTRLRDGENHARRYCEHRETDYSETCPTCGTTAGEFIADATSWLYDHVGATAEDPGYFSPEYIEQQREETARQ
jgi:hypothetical protein